MDFDEIASEAKELLESTLESAYQSLSEKDGVSIRENFAYRLARHINELSGDFILLEAEGGFHGSPVVLRSILESVFSLGAILSDRSFAALQCISEINDLLKKIASSSDPDLITELRNLREELCADHSLQSNPTALKVWEIAKLAKMEGVYEKHYYWLSKAIHPTLVGTIEGESGGTSGIRTGTFSFALATATGFLVQIIRTDEPQTRIDKAANILRLVSGKHEDGSVGLMNESEAMFKDELNAFLHSEIKPTTRDQQ
ncbi:MAG: DUF5677 domain-containing protein [Verrucomicrobiales bacterium]